MTARLLLAIALVSGLLPLGGCYQTKEQRDALLVSRGVQLLIDESEFKDEEINQYISMLNGLSARGEAYSAVYLKHQSKWEELRCRQRQLEAEVIAYQADVKQLEQDRKHWWRP